MTEIINSYDDACVTGDAGVRKVVELLKKYYHLTNKQIRQLPPFDPQGDLIIVPGYNDTLGSVQTVEVKTEKNQIYGNFALEEWSNKTTERRGWMYTLKCDRLVYTFMDWPKVYVFKFPTLQKWFMTNSENYSLKPQQQREQKNDTWNRCVPIQDVLTAVPHIILR
jgi:hypothetical protein